MEEDDIRKYLQGTVEEMYDPGLLLGMECAVEILERKIRENKQIRIIGDYDADASAPPLSCIRACSMRGLGGYCHSAPDEGRYGLNEHLVEDAWEAGVDTIITCDNGIAAAPQIELAKKKE